MKMLITFTFFYLIVQHVCAGGVDQQLVGLCSHIPGIEMKVGTNTKHRKKTKNCYQVVKWYLVYLVVVLLWSLLLLLLLFF